MKLVTKYYSGANNNAEKSSCNLKRATSQTQASIYIRQVG